MWALRPAKPLGVLSRHPCRNPNPFPSVKGSVCLVDSASCRAFGHTRPASVPGLSVGLPPSPRLGLRPKPHFQKLYRFIDSLKRGALAPRFAISYYLSYQNAILSSMYFFTSAIGILSCFIESRSRTVTQPSSTLSKSYVMQKGVPISSCLLYLLPIAPASS